MSYKITILIPCLNEIETIGIVINKAANSLRNHNIYGEILVADNGSTDGSQLLAASLGARVVDISVNGYGAALLGGIETIQSKFTIMCDGDDSYSLEDLPLFIERLDLDFDLVVGNRFQGGIAPGAMPWLHKYLGNPILSFLGRLLFKVPIGDFHCGLRAFKTDSIKKLHLMSTGMEFASEMIVKAKLNGLRITEVPTTLKPDGRTRKPHLRTWRDGWRHLIFLFAASPRYLFLVPAVFLLGIATTGMTLTFLGPFKIADIYLDTNSFLIFAALFLTGLQLLLSSIVVRIFTSRFGFIPANRRINAFERFFTLERGIVLAIVSEFVAFGLFLFLYLNWTGEGFSKISIEESLRISGLLIIALCGGIQIFFASFFASIIQTNHNSKAVY
jgi:glycosyltransferase involved in cell wall biosynthesis